ncbi:MAG: hypothetical protein WCF22_21395 [Candidatus Sulfotelmatobacter sp.]
MTPLSTPAFFFGFPLFDLPWYMQQGVAIFMGAAAIWAVFSGEEFHLKYQTEPLPHQFFYRICFVVLGLSMIGLSLWGLLLGRP